MPLKHGKSRKAFESNIKTEMEHGKPQPQALAIAYSVKRKAKKKKAAGGSVESGSPDMNYAEGAKVGGGGKVGGASTSTTGNKTKTGGSNPGGASTGGAGTVTITTGKMPPKGINISDVGGRTAARNSGGMDPSDEDDTMMKAEGGYAKMRKYSNNYADGGQVNAKYEKRPMPDNRYNDSAEASRNSGNKASRQDSWSDNPTIKQAQKGPKTTRIKHPKMVPQDAYSTRLRNEEDDLQISAGTNEGPQRQPPEHDNEVHPLGRADAVQDMADSHSTRKPPYRRSVEDQYSEDEASPEMYADGGDVSDSHLSDYRMKHAHLNRDQHLEKAKEVRSGAEGMSDRYKRSMETLAKYHESEAKAKAGKYAKGGRVEDSDYDHLDPIHDQEELDMTPEAGIQERERGDEHHLQSRLDPSEDEGRSDAMSRNEEHPLGNEDDVPDMEKPHNKNQSKIYGYAQGGNVDMHEEMDDQPEDEAETMHNASLAAAIMSKRRAAARLHSDSDIDTQMYMAEGGDIHSHDSIYSDDSDIADVSRNADEDANEEDQLSFDALRKENYSESEGLRQLDQPEDSNLTDDPREASEENEHDGSLVGKIRKKMMKRSPITR